MPLPKDTFRDLGNAKFFNMLGLRPGLHNITVMPEYGDKTLSGGATKHTSLLA
jgi:hypothetical protein